MTRLRRFAATAAFAALSTVSSLATAAGYSGLYVFGDSLSDRGNLASLANAAQVITGNSYIPSVPYASGQLTNGDVWVKPFAGALGLAAYGQPASLGGGDFAFGGARVNTDGAGLPPSLTLQTGLFFNATGNVAPGTALYVMAGGGNDARDALTAAATAAAQAAATATDPTAAINAIVGQAATNYAQNTGAIIDQLQSAGAQHIIVWDVPDLARAPAVTFMGGQAVALGGMVSQAMNAALVGRLASETGVTLFDLYGLQNSFFAAPSSFGLTNVQDACGAVVNACDPATSLFWDGIHPTAFGHQLIANAMFTTAVPEPSVMALLLTGLLLMGWRTHRAAPHRGAPRL